MWRGATCLRAYAPDADILSLAAAKLPAYKSLIDTAVEFGKSKSSNLEEQAENAMDRLLVAFGCELLNAIPGRVSTEVDAAFSFDKSEPGFCFDILIPMGFVLLDGPSKQSAEQAKGQGKADSFL